MLQSGFVVSVEGWGSLTHTRVQEVTDRIVARSKASRARYLERVSIGQSDKPRRQKLGCANQAHGFAACNAQDKAVLREGDAGNIAILTSYNDMLSAHQPYERYPELIRAAAREAGGVAQVAGGVPAMCDGITQGETGMELSLFSRDTIAMSTAVALSHQTFDAGVYLGICDKIVPGLVIGALSFGHLPAVFLPSGPMTSGYSNDDRKVMRQKFAEGLITRAELLDVEAKSYHEAGTCTFYGTANTNQMMMEIMGLHLPGSSFVNPNTPLRDALTREAVRRSLEISDVGADYTPLGEMLDERVFVNAIVGLLATGGSTNHTMHLVAMAGAAGIRLDWRDFEDLAAVTPEAVDGGPISLLRDGDLVRLDSVSGEFCALVDEAEWASRVPATADLRERQYGVGRELFSAFRRTVGPADQGASIFTEGWA